MDKTAPVKTKKLVTWNAFLFLVFLVISGFLWFLFALSRRYVVEMDVPVRYVNLPQEYLVTTPLPHKIKANIRDIGFNEFVSHWFSKDSVPIIIDLGERFDTTRHDFIIPQGELSKMISGRMSTSAEVQDCYPRSIYVKYERLYSKEVKVALRSDIQTSDQYDFDGPIRLTPQTVTVYVPRPLLDSIQAVETERVILKNVKSAQHRTVRLVSPSYVRCVPPAVAMDFDVKQFTEKTVAVTVEGKNVPQGYLLRSFPASVQVKFNVDLQDYDSIEAEDIRVYADYRRAGDSSRYCLLEAVCSHPKIRNLRVKPSSVEYILEQKLH